MIAVATAVVVRISLVAVGWHLIGIAWGMALGDVFAARHMSARARIGPFQRMRRRSLANGKD